MVLISRDKCAGKLRLCLTCKMWVPWMTVHTSHILVWWAYSNAPLGITNKGKQPWGWIMVCKISWICVYMYGWMDGWMNRCMYEWMYVLVCMYRYLCIYVWIWMYLCMDICVWVFMYVCICILMLILRYVGLCIHVVVFFMYVCGCGWLVRYVCSYACVCVCSIMNVCNVLYVCLCMYLYMYVHPQILLTCLYHTFSYWEPRFWSVPWHMPQIKEKEWRTG